ncbi:metal-sensitive transcriptional regulator [Erysipelothrix sp. Poltava]|nr:metal-sensitive transcriptional regulator [Erysipelothrix sp. Poltava]
MTCEKQLLNRLKRAEGQIRGVTRMLEEGESSSRCFGSVNGCTIKC